MERRSAVPGAWIAAGAVAFSRIVAFARSRLDETGAHTEYRISGVLTSIEMRAKLRPLVQDLLATGAVEPAKCAGEVAQMPMFVTCLCGMTHTVQDECAGLRGRCPNCGRVRHFIKLGAATRGGAGRTLDPEMATEEETVAPRWSRSLPPAGVKPIG